jgi:hypothetical protein
MTVDEVIWGLFLETRKQIIEYQKIRAQLFGFKVIFVGSAMGIVLANANNIPKIVHFIPAFAATFFDLLITSTTYSIKRTGAYCRNHIEPTIRESSHLPSSLPLWEEQFLISTGMERVLLLISNLGISLLALMPVILAVQLPLKFNTFTVLLALFLFLFGFYLYVALLPHRFGQDVRPSRVALF